MFRLQSNAGKHPERTGAQAQTWSGPASALYLGDVRHVRFAPKRHDFTYRVFSLFLDIDRLEQTTAGLRFLSLNTFGPFSFHEKDHGPKDGTSLRAWVDAHLERTGLGAGIERVYLLCFPRVLGYVFNPLSVFYAMGADGTPRAVIYEVNNTFGDTHAYVCPVEAASPGAAFTHQSAQKQMHVSPFFDLDMRYAFRLSAPGDTLKLAIRNETSDGPVHLATLSGQRQALSDANLAKLFAAQPLMTMKVIAAIHWEAFHLWRKGMRYHSRPKEPRPAASRGWSGGLKGDPPAAARETVKL